MLHADSTSQPDGKAPDHHPQQEASTVATPAGKEAPSPHLAQDTPSSDFANRSSPTVDGASRTAIVQPADPASSHADAEADTNSVSVKQLIQRRSSGTAVSAHFQSVCSVSSAC